MMKITLTHEFDFEDQSELKTIVGANDLCCAIYDFEDKLRAMWKYYEPESGLDFETIDKIRDIWNECMEDVRWVME